MLTHSKTSRRELVAAKNLAREKHIEALTERLAILMENPGKVRRLHCCGQGTDPLPAAKAEGVQRLGDRSALTQS